MTVSTTTVPCPNCGGSGTCPRCGGSGGGDSAEAQCPQCRGDGDCQECEGEGLVPADPEESGRPQ
jgi:hypothetical protein